jgi:hypothetical protein
MVEKVAVSVICTGCDNVDEVVGTGAIICPGMLAKDSVRSGRNGAQGIPKHERLTC